ncbi:hypothetical protein ACVIJ6_000530 [Bradyrhizobium sp. USDA 4369]
MTDNAAGRADGRPVIHVTVTAAEPDDLPGS